MNRPSADEVRDAIRVVRDSRRTHVDWLTWQERNPDWREQMTADPDPENVGDEDHHRGCVADYDRVIDVLKRCLP